MKIGEVIEIYMDILSGMVWNPDKIISQGKTSEDVFSDVIITALNKYKDKEVDPQEAFEYIKKTLLMEMKFQPKRTDNIIFTDNLRDVIDDSTLSA